MTGPSLQGSEIFDAKQMREARDRVLSLPRRLESKGLCWPEPSLHM
jgi:hypothetical protein